MDPSFIPIEVVPSKTPFGLDQLRRGYKTALSAEAAIAAAPAVGTADEVFPCMFLMPISTPESAESATRIELLYMGTIAFTGTGAEGDPFLPVLPAQKHDNSNAVQSASSSKGSDGETLTSPITVQYYSPNSVLTYFSFGAPGTVEADDPAAVPVIITLTTGDTTFDGGAGGVQSTVDIFFSLQLLSTIDSTEIVPGQYWQNAARKSKTYGPWIYASTSGTYISLYAGGRDYAVGNSLTISAGGESATIIIDTLGLTNSVTGYHVTASTFTVSHTMIMATGGSGTGAGFNVFVIP